MLPFVLAGICHDRRTCIFNLETTRTYKALSKALQEAKRGSDVTRIFLGMMEEIKRLSRVKENEPFPNYDKAYSYIQSKYTFARNQMVHINRIAKEKLFSIYRMEHLTSEDKEKAQQQYSAELNNLDRIDYNCFEAIRGIYEHLERINDSYWAEIKRKADKVRENENKRKAKQEEERRQAREEELKRQEEEFQMRDKKRRAAELAAVLERWRKESEDRKAKELKEARSIPDDPKTKVTPSERQSFLKLSRMMDSIKEPTAEDIEALDDFKLDTHQ
ncbi:hypothetical protein DSO57_1014323 [Entomophthora muscae]|uniref:Uncharacterized protein n=1 Tax=Entomophthora muscae TaxID=34485 RepID=A0ACC2SID2_9FUNG|nr:hypothetical protein DSO57_1014323 [Entomophthora muscae]